MQGWDSPTGQRDGRPCSLHLLICGFLSLSPFLFLFDCAGLFGRLAAAGPRPGLQVTEGVIYATITMGMACFPNLKCLFLTTATKKPKKNPKNSVLAKIIRYLPLDLPVTCMEGNHLSLSVMQKALFFVAFPVLRMTMKRTSLDFIPLVLPLVWS